MLALVCHFMYIYTWASGPLYILQAFSRQVLKCCLLSLALLLAICSRVLYVVWRARHSFSPTRTVKNRQLNYERYITAASLCRWRIAYRWRIVSLLSRYSSLFINLSPFFLHNFGPERKHALLLLDETFFSGTMLTLVFRLMYIYGPTSIHGLP